MSQAIVSNLARPSANVTGLSQMAPELSGKRLELLREVVPKLSRLATLWKPEIRFPHSVGGNATAGSAAEGSGSFAGDTKPRRFESTGVAALEITMRSVKNPARVGTS